MFEEINYLNGNDKSNEEYIQALIKQMEIGYQEMGEINLQISEEMRHTESEAEYTTNEFIKNKI